MPVHTECPCGQKVKARDELAGKRVRCPACGQIVVLPRANPIPVGPPMQPAQTRPASAPPSVATKKRSRKSSTPRAEPGEGGITLMTLFAGAIKATRDKPAHGTPVTVRPGWHKDGLLYFVCQGCAVEAPTREVKFEQVISAVVVWFHKAIRGRLCKDCIETCYRKFTRNTLLWAWWGFPSCIAAPFIPIINKRHYRNAADLEPVPADACVPELHDDAANRLEAVAATILADVGSGRDFESVSRAAAQRAGVTPAQAALYLCALIFHKRIVEHK